MPQSPALQSHLASLYRRVEDLEHTASRLLEELTELREHIGDTLLHPDEDLWEVPDEAPAASSSSSQQPTRAEPANTDFCDNPTVVVPLRSIQRETARQKKYYVVLESPRGYPDTSGIHYCTWEGVKGRFGNKNCGHAVRSRKSKADALALWYTSHSTRAPVPWREQEHNV
jgi:hypothetical protein